MSSSLNRCSAVVISANYRLAPEYPYPTPLEDCYAGAVWIVDHAEELGVDPERIAVHGHSAGASLAAGVCLLARDRGTPRIAFQYLGYPALDDRLQTPSMLRFIDTPMWDRPNAELSWAHYLGEAAGTIDVPIYAAPGRAEDLSGLPPACVTAMQFDPLRDEDVDYARNLVSADVPTELHLYPGTFHGSGRSRLHGFHSAKPKRKSRSATCAASTFGARLLALVVLMSWCRSAAIASFEACLYPCEK